MKTRPEPPTWCLSFSRRFDTKIAALKQRPGVCQQAAGLADDGLKVFKRQPEHRQRFRLERVCLAAKAQANSERMADGVGGMN